MQVPPSRRRIRLFRALYGVGALTALAGGALLAHYTSEMRAPLNPSRETSLNSRAEPIRGLPPAGTGDRPARPQDRGVRVEILNGCGEPGVMDPFVRRLRSEGFDVIKTGNARSFGYVESVVIDRAGNRENAEEVARILGIGAVIQQVKEDPYRIEEVTMILGRDHRKLGVR